ncbi:nitroreductase family deazaflavin-dependent oxidoreductase [Mycolicibacterium sp. CH28]|nr:nitroreductase family deazaflavin-dependent oxidoreductase [Mycolicibacterium sp. CH28]TGD90314.1 nitroreductase family deazaflavin-dependent oxidoreductase [Mycolicibacterium sp. CH28]
MTEFDADQLRNNPDALKTFNDQLVADFRANGGKVGPPFENADLVLLTTTGAKSGQPRLSPLAYLTVDGRILIVGSYGGAPKDPAWVHNLRANPRAHVEIGTESYDVVTRELPADERDALFAKVVALAPGFGEYQTKTSRVIPLFELTRA